MPMAMSMLAVRSAIASFISFLVATSMDSKLSINVLNLLAQSALISAFLAMGRYTV